jgi:cysteine synthase
MDDHARALDEFEHIKARIYRILGDGLRELAFASTAVSMAELRMRLEAMRHYFVLGDRVDALVADFADGKRTRQETIARVRELAQEEAERVGYSSAAELLADKESEG